MEFPSIRKILKNTGWNLLGTCLPILVALAAFPVLAHRLGEERLGALSLIWMLVGYFSVFDLGFSRALTKLVAEKLGKGRESEVPALFWTALTCMTALGLVGALAMYFLAPWIAFDLLKASDAMRDEIRVSFQWVAFSLPLIISVMGLVGTLEAYQQFKLINLIRIPMGSYTFLGPLAVVLFTDNLIPVVMVLIAGRMAEWGFYFVMCLKQIPALRSTVTTRRALIPPLLRFGGWMTVSNLLLPLMYQVDRFLIGSLVAVFSVAYYITASEIVVKILGLSRALVTVLFPSFSAHFETRPDETRALYLRSIKLLQFFLFPAVLAVMSFSYEGLMLWLGPQYAENSYRVMQWLCLGIFIASLSYIPYSLIQGAGKPRATAIVHLVEIVLYVLLSIWWIEHEGLVGAAKAWVVRALLDFLVMTALASRILRLPVREAWEGVGLMTLSIGMMSPAMILDSLTLRIVWFCAGTLFFSLAMFGVGLGREEKAAALRLFRR